MRGVDLPCNVISQKMKPRMARGRDTAPPAVCHPFAV